MEITNWLNWSGKRILLIVGFAFATEVAWRIYKNYGSFNRRNKQNTQTVEPIVDVLFFTEKSSECKNHLNFNTPCSMSTCAMIQLNKLVKYISSATRTLDVCVYFLTCVPVVKAILDAQKRNVIVRVITDDESSDNDASQVFNMRKAGIKVRSRKSVYLMHHKFAIVDRKILITGSANWTIQAFFGNCENILIVNHCDIVSIYINEFDKLWLRFSNEASSDKHNGTSV